MEQRAASGLAGWREFDHERALVNVCAYLRVGGVLVRSWGAVRFHRSPDLCRVPLDVVVAELERRGLTCAPVRVAGSSAPAVGSADVREMFDFLVRVVEVDYPELAHKFIATGRELIAVRGELAFTEWALAGAIRELGGELDVDALLARDGGED